MQSHTETLSRPATAETPVVESDLRRRLILAGMGGIATAAFASPQFAQASAEGKSNVLPEGIVRTTLQRYEDTDGTEFNMVLTTFPPGVAAPSHHHPSIGFNYIISGVAESQYEGEELKRFVAGDSYQDKPNAAHRIFRNANADAPLVYLLCYRVKRGQSFRTIP